MLFQKKMLQFEMIGTKGVEFILFFKMIAVRRNTIIKRKLTLQD